LPPLEDVANESSKISDQLALPEPPQPIKTSSVPNHEQQLLDLLSGNLNSDMSPQAPVTPPIIASNEHHPVSSPISQQQSTGNSYASNIYQQQPYSNGSTSNMQPFSSHQGYQTRPKSSTTNQPSFTPADRLFGDLIDMRSARASFKRAEISQNLSTPSSSKEGTG
jgi:hypothetical protein